MSFAALRRFVGVVPFVLAACTAAPTPDPAPVRQPFAPAGAARRVVMLSFDGLGADALAQQPGLRSFEWLARSGAAARVITVDPTQTAPAHATLLTGAQPQRHGIVANRFHIAGTPFTEAARGLDAEIGVETIVEAARRQGKRVGAIAFPTIDGRGPRRTADFGLLWSPPVTRPQTVTLTRKNFRSEWVPPTWTRRDPSHRSFSPVMRAKVGCGSTFAPAFDVQLVAYDTTDDRLENYDAIVVESEGKEVPADARGWFALTRRVEGEVLGSWSRVAPSDAKLERVDVYCGSFAKTSAYPEAFRAVVEEEAGFWPGEPDPGAGAEIYREQIERFATFLTRTQMAAVKRMQFDLLLAYQPQIDESGHAFTLTEQSQPSFTPESANVAAAVRRTAFEHADRAVASIASVLDLTRDALVVVGDHGVVPVAAEVRVNRLLTERGFYERWRAFASGNVANIYRTAGTGDDQAQLVEVLRQLPWFELVQTKTASSHPNSGDIVATAHPHVVLSPSSEPPLTAAPRETGSHGALNRHRALHTVFFAIGAGVPRREHEDVSQTKIARYVATLSGMEPPAEAEK